MVGKIVGFVIDTGDRLELRLDNLKDEPVKEYETFKLKVYIGADKVYLSNVDGTEKSIPLELVYIPKKWPKEEVYAKVAKTDEGKLILVCPLCPLCGGTGEPFAVAGLSGGICPRCEGLGNYVEKRA